MKWYAIITIVAGNAANEWEHSSAGRASALQAEGHRFEPYCSHQNEDPDTQVSGFLFCIIHY